MLLGGSRKIRTLTHTFPEWKFPGLCTNPVQDTERLIKDLQYIQYPQLVFCRVSDVLKG